MVWLDLGKRLGYNNCVNGQPTFQHSPASVGQLEGAYIPYISLVVRKR